jgi:homoserine dehydrogenase
MLSLCVLGYGTFGQSLVRKIKSLPNYLSADGLNGDIQIHTVHVSDNSSEKYSSLREVYWKLPEGNFSCLKDGDERTPRETPFDSDTPWLVESEGHNVIVETMTYNEDSKALVIDLIKKGHWVLISNKTLVQNHLDEILQAATFSGARLSFNMISAGIPKYVDIDLNEKSIKNYYKDSNLYLERSGAIDKTVSVAIDEITGKREKKALSSEGFLACGTNDTVDWENLK